MVDDLGPEWISAYGSESIKTPHIDRLAERGYAFLPGLIRCRNVHLLGSPCSQDNIHIDTDGPIIGMCLDGAPVLTSIPIHNYSFARLFREAGYATAAAGKWQINDFRVQPNAMVLHGF